MNLGQGELGFGAWPSAKSRPVAEYCTVFKVSTPIALDALAMTVLASWADALQTTSAARTDPLSHFFSMWHLAIVSVVTRQADNVYRNSDSLPPAGSRATHARRGRRLHRQDGDARLHRVLDRPEVAGRDA